MIAGIHRKYEVKRTDGSSEPGREHAECAYFVLDLACDEFAIPALKAYVRACKKTKPELAADLQAIIDTPSTRCHCREVGCPHSLGQALMPDGPSGQAHVMMDEEDEDDELPDERDECTCARGPFDDRDNVGFPCDYCGRIVR